MRFRILLFLLAKLMIRADAKNQGFSKLARKKDVIFQLQTADRKCVRHFIIVDGRIATRSTFHEKPDFTIHFKNAGYGYSVLTSKNKKAFIEGVLNNDIQIDGDISLVIWFQNLIGQMRASKVSIPAHIGTIGFVGAGLIGAPMIRSLLRSGFTVKAHDVSAEALKDVEADGAERCFALEEMVDVQVLIIMVNNMEQVEEVALNFCRSLPEGGRLPVLVMSTVSPDFMVQLRQKLDQAGGKDLELLDAPVSGAPLNAEAGKLSIMVGGDGSAFERLKPIFQALGENIFHVGELGKGSAMKLVNNILGLTNGLNTAEALFLGVQKGLNVDDMIEAINAGSGQNFITVQWPLSKKMFEMIRSGSALGAKQALFSTGMKDLVTTKNWAAMDDLDIPCVNNGIEQIENLTESRFMTILKAITE
ncbi:MAG: NAD(P)-dependent oxidoreductase [Proteobacteria bacterium]|nr:NAD(P)-dependent oxidoreductase [Pseudomonadota bacterium]